MTKRKASDEEKALFEAVLSGKVALKTPRRLSLETPAIKRKPSPKAPSGINGGTAEKLHRGDLEPDCRIDLHGMTENVAHGALIEFIARASKRGAKLALVITGKGMRKPDPYAPFDMELDARARGVLRNMVPRWLNEPPLVSLIADIRPSHNRHGGSGALYVYLRKAPKRF